MYALLASLATPPACPRPPVPRPSPRGTLVNLPLPRPVARAQPQGCRMAPLQALLRCASAGTAAWRAACVPTPGETCPRLACLPAGHLAAQPLLAGPAAAR